MRPDLSTQLRQAGLLTAIPFVLLVGPAIGYYLGTALDHRWSHAPWGMGLGIALGLLASARVTIQFIQQARDMSEHEPPAT
jgi:F0F1-type ATP synthase assembly protein I